MFPYQQANLFLWSFCVPVQSLLWAPAPPIADGDGDPCFALEVHFQLNGHSNQKLERVENVTQISRAFEAE